MNEPEWVAEKALIDSYDDGYGPYLAWLLCEGDERKAWESLWSEFKSWAASNLGQGYSMACEDGALLDQITHWCFVGYCAGSKAAGRSQ